VSNARKLTSGMAGVKLRLIHPHFSPVGSIGWRQHVRAPSGSGRETPPSASPGKATPLPRLGFRPYGRGKGTNFESVGTSV